MRKRLEHRLNQLDAVRRLGVGWILFRLRYAAERKFGLLERRTAAREWFPLSTTPREMPDVAAVDALQVWLKANYSPEDIERLRQHHRNMQERRFDVFGTTVELDSWHSDPIGSVRYNSAVHWSNVGHFSSVDVKRVWEPSRFGWAFDLARLYLIEPESGASDTFWQLFDWWCDENPPNYGINWDCGQEASIRLMAVVLACDVMRSDMTNERWAKLERFADTTADRVAANIAYARSQKNNHHTSEAAGLITFGALFPHLRNAKKHLRIGNREMIRACSTLVLDDGGTSQYSTNYHRVFLHGLCWVAALSTRTLFELPLEAERAVHRATKFWTTLQDPVSGLIPLIGHNDGANILPLAKGAHIDGRPATALAQAVANRASVLAPGPWDEASYWLGIDASELVNRPRVTSESGLKSFPNMGIHILWAGRYRVIFRCGPFQFRPAHADQLHTDIWWDGVPLSTAPGTYSYNPADKDAPNFGDSQFHNTMTLARQNHMPRVGRFLFARWTAGSTAISESSVGVSVSGVLRLGRLELKRSIVVSSCGVEVEDKTADLRVVSRWALENECECEVETDQKIEFRQLRPSNYGGLRVAKVVEIKTGSIQRVLISHKRDSVGPGPNALERA